MAEIPSGSVIITPDDMWKTVQDTARSTLRTESAVRELTAIVNPALNEVRIDISKLDLREKENHVIHDERIRRLEEQSWASRWVPVLVTAVLTAVIGGVILYAILHLPN